jgi:hypothetical protein
MQVEKSRLCDQPNLENIKTVLNQNHRHYHHVHNVTVAFQGLEWDFLANVGFEQFANISQCLGEVGFLDWF